MTQEVEPKWAKLVAIQPALRELAQKIMEIKDPGDTEYFCANEVWYGYQGNESLKNQMSDLVGFHVRDKEKDAYLYTMKAYDDAYFHLYYSLPQCRNCNCA